MTDPKIHIETDIEYANRVAKLNMEGIDNVGNYILWIGGIDDHYENFDDAEMAKFEWEAKGYDDVYIETRAELLERDK